ncbi:MAG: hypothetical protein AAF564_20750 [Bacteroidota bacterium]
MTPEEYKRIKEAEKEHLRALKKLKSQLRTARQQNNVAEAMKKIENAPGDDLTRTHEEMVDRLAMDTIREEARLEMALSETGEVDSEPATEGIDETTAEEKIVQSDAELQKLRAQELVRQIKLQMGLADVKKKQNDASSVKHETHAAGEEDEDAGMVEEKSTEAAPEKELPEKTIGRIPRKKL